MSRDNGGPPFAEAAGTRRGGFRTGNGKIGREPGDSCDEVMNPGDVGPNIKTGFCKRVITFPALGRTGDLRSCFRRLRSQILTSRRRTRKTHTKKRGCSAD